MNILTIIKRLLALPFVLGICLIGSLSYSIKCVYLFLKNGGEFIPYIEKDSKKTIADVFSKLVSIQEETKQLTDAKDRT